MEQITGSYPWNEGVNVEEPWKEKLDGLYEWLGAYGIADHIAKKLYEQKYLTEGDFAKLINFKSELKNPFHYVCGDVNVWRSYLEKEIERRKKIAEQTYLRSEEYLQLQTIALIHEALEKCHNKGN